LSDILTDFSVSPYWDDYKQDKQFYKILFVPSRAVQVREVNQIQTIIQRQISRFADHQFKDGSIVSGCNMVYIPDLHFIRCGVFNNPTNTQFTTEALKDFLLYNPENGLRAAVLLATPGYLGNYPDTAHMHIRYLNTGYDSSGIAVKNFKSQDLLHIYNTNQDKFGTLDPKNLYNTINLIRETVDTPVAEGKSYGITVGDGIVYQKGYFVNVNPHTISVRKFDQDISDMLVGFETQESIVSYLEDTSLIDPVDSTNRSGIGADRLKLNPVLVAKNKADIGSDSDFFPIVEFGEETKPVKQNTEPEYNILGEEFAKRTFEESGDYYIKPFVVTTKNHEQSSKFYYTVDKGIAYVKGERIETINKIDIEAPRNTETKFYNDNIITPRYGNYIIIKEVRGIPLNNHSVKKISIHSNEIKAVTTNQNVVQSTNPVIGELKCIFIERSNIHGNFKLYIDDIKTIPNVSFVNSAKALSFTAPGLNFMADIVLDSNGKVRIFESGEPSFIFPIGLDGVKSLKNSSGDSDTQFRYFASLESTTDANGLATFNLPPSFAGGNERLFASPGVLSDGLKNNIYITNSSNHGLIDPTTCVINIISNNQFTVKLPGPGVSNLRVLIPVIRNGAIEKKLTLHKRRFVKIQVGTNAAGLTGPYELGMCNVVRFRNVFVGTDTNVNPLSPNIRDWFTLDNGHTSKIIGGSKLVLKPQYQGKLSNNDFLLVEFDVLVTSFVTGVGFYSVDSYPVMHPGDVSTDNNMSFDDIPIVGGYDLRNCIDFRDTYQNSANLTNNRLQATINPPAPSILLKPNDNNYLVLKDSNIIFDMEAYLPRVDLIELNSKGKFNIKSSTPDEHPLTPRVSGDSMEIAYAFVPSYPGITADQSPLFHINKPRIKIKLTGNRGYTMRDIGSLDKRISRLEYYQTLSMLEQKAKDISVKDENGLDRFKNGIFADPLNDHSLGDFTNFEYDVAVDERVGVARPKIKRNYVDLKVKSSNNIKIINSRFAVLDYDNDLHISQIYASKVRNATESVWNWTGNAKLYPEFDHHKNETILPENSIEIDNTTPWEQFANTPFAQQFGDWDVSNTTVLENEKWVNTTTWGKHNRHGQVTHNADFVTTTTSTRVNDFLDVKSTSNKQDLGSSLVDFTTSPYINSRDVAIIANSLRPNTQFWVFFDNQPVTNHCFPAAPNPQYYNINTGKINIPKGNENLVLSKVGNKGSILKSDDRGNLYVVFNIPPNTFKTGERKIIICDVDNIKTANDAITSSASSTFVASSIAVSSRKSSITTKDPIVSTGHRTETIVDVNTENRNFIASEWHYDPLAQSFFVDVNSSGIFVDSIGVFFSKKSPSLGISCMITEMIAGVPDGNSIIATSHLNASQVKVSSNASQETVFKFDEIPYLTSGKSYAFFLKPDGDSPDYLVWMSEVGGEDILTKTKIFSNPYLGVAFRSANSQSWDVLSTEDIKFNLYRCKFKTNSADLILDEENDITFIIDSITFKNGHTRILNSDTVFQKDSPDGASKTNTPNPQGFVNIHDTVTNTLHVQNVGGNFKRNGIISVHRPMNPVDRTQANDSNEVAVISYSASHNIAYSIIVPQLSYSTPSGTNINTSIRVSDFQQNLSPKYIPVDSDKEYEFDDNMYVIASRNNKTIDSNLEVKVSMLSNSDMISPIVDLRRKSVIAIQNLINNDISGEEGRHGKSLTRYISIPVNLAEGQDAEDLLLYISAYRPPRTNIHAYIKAIAPTDFEDFYLKKWTKLYISEGENSFSSTIDKENFIELKYSIPTTGSQGTGYLNGNGVFEYKTVNNQIHNGFKRFAIKLVFSSEVQFIVPKVSDVRALCLQA